MAEINRGIEAEAVDVVFTDGTRTQALTKIKKASVTFTLFREQSNDVAMYQDGGSEEIFDVHTHLSGPGKISMKLFCTDPLNATDVTDLGIFEALYKDTVTGTGLATAPWTSTNPTPSATRFMLDIQMRLSRAAGASTHQTGLAAVYCETLAEVAPEDGFYCYQVDLRYVEEFAWS